jgi:hypothetical protein
MQISSASGLGFVLALAVVAMPANRAAVLKRIADRRVGVVGLLVAADMGCLLVDG